MAWKYECTVFVKPIKLTKWQKGGKRKRKKRQEIERVRQNTTKRNPPAVCLCAETDTIQVEISFSGKRHTVYKDG